MSNQDRPIEQPDQTGSSLRRQVEEEILRRVIDGVRDRENLTPEQFCKLVQAYCELRKQDAAFDKNRAAVEAARLRASPSRDRKAAGSSRHASDLDAPYGRKDDGTPYTEAEFQDALARSVREIYGIQMDAPEPANAAGSPSP